MEWQDKRKEGDKYLVSRYEGNISSIWLDNDI
jgi:hypothetical protein